MLPHRLLCPEPPLPGECGPSSPPSSPACLQLYEDALQVDGACLQALFNAALACRALCLPDRALALVQQLLHASPGHAEALWQAGDLCDELGDTARAVEWLTRLLTKTPHDSTVLSRLGALHARWAAPIVRPCAGQGRAPRCSTLAAARSMLAG